MIRESLGLWDSENIFFIGLIFNKNASTVFFFFCHKVRHGQLAQPTGLFTKQNRLDNDAVLRPTSRTHGPRDQG